MKISKIVSIIKDLGVDVEGVEDALKDKLKDGLNDFGKTLLYKTKEKIKEGALDIIGMVGKHFILNIKQ